MKQRRYSILKMHEEGHALGKNHPDEPGSYIPNWQYEPNWRGYMSSSLWWDVTLEDTNINKTIAKNVGHDLLCLNQYRTPCLLSNNDVQKLQVDISIYPNPTISDIIIDSNYAEDILRDKITLINILGQRLPIKVLPNRNIDISNLYSGNYFIYLPLKNGKYKIFNIIKI